jgi:hypothetical protein
MPSRTSLEDPRHVSSLAPSPPETPRAITVAATAAAREGLETLRRLLDDLRRQTRKWIWIESLALVCLAGAAVFWGTLALDWLLEPPAWARGAAAAAVFVGLLLLLRGKLFSRLAAPLDDASLATLVERGHAGFRDSLSTAIELSREPHDDVDPALFGRTVDEAVAVAGDVRPATFFRRRRLVGLALAGFAAAASIGGLALARPAIADLWVRRMVLLGDAPWPRSTGLAVEGFSPAGRRKVARGSDVEIVVRADAGKVIPEVVDLRSRGDGGWKTDRMGMRGGVVDGAQAFGHVLRAVTDDVDLEIRGGDARLRNLRLEVVDAPALEALVIRYTLPAYLGGGARQVAASRIVQIPRGSTVDIACTSTKPLSAATITAIAEAGEETLAAMPAGDLESGRLQGGRQIAVRLERLEGERTFVVRLTDTDGLVNREPISFVLAAVPDEPPSVAVRMRGVSTAVTPRATIPLEGTVSDDHALAAVAATLSIAGGPTATLPIPLPAGEGAILELTSERPFRVALEPLSLVPGGKLSLVVAAEDGCTLDGGPNKGAGDAWTLDVVTPEALVAMLEAREIILRRRYESCIADLAQVRDRMASGEISPANAGAGAANGDADSSAAARLGEAAARAAGETGEIAEAFRMIQVELGNNLLLTPELEARLVTQIADPLAAIAAKDLPGLTAACRSGAGRAGLLQRADDVLARMRSVLDKMIELESFNEVVELLRGMIRTQEEIRAETLKRQKQRAREALGEP